VIEAKLIPDVHPLIMAGLTEWELQQIVNIDLLLRNAEVKNAEFNRVHTLLNEGDQGVTEANERLRFRCFLIDLYSVLDYMCFLLYCHYKNEGRPAFSIESRNVNFPFTNNLRRFQGGDRNIDPERAHQNRRNNWIRERCRLIFGEEREDQEDWNYFSEFVLSLQPLLYVNAAGDPIAADDVPEIEGDAESFSLLHFFRNYCTHRDLVHLFPDAGVFYINLNTNERRFVPEGGEQPFQEANQNDVQQLEITSKGFWVEVPYLQNYHQDRGIQPTRPKPLLSLASRLLSFVIITRNNLLTFTLNNVPRYSHVVRRANDGLSVDGTVYPWENYDHILKRIVH